MMEWWKRAFGLHPVEFILYFVAGGFAIAALKDASTGDAISLLGVTVMFGGYAWLRQRAISRLPIGPGLTSGEVRLAELDSQAEELHELRGRLVELEERVDFAERLLAQQVEVDRLAGGR